MNEQLKNKTEELFNKLEGEWKFRDVSWIGRNVKGLSVKKWINILPLEGRYLYQEYYNDRNWKNKTFATKGELIEFLASESPEFVTVQLS